MGKGSETKIKWIRHEKGFKNEQGQNENKMGKKDMKCKRSG